MWSLSLKAPGVLGFTQLCTASTAEIFLLPRTAIAAPEAPTSNALGSSTAAA